MGKYTNLDTSIFEVFGSTVWKSEKVKTFPANFQTTGVGDEFIRVAIIPRTSGLNLASVSGILMIDIFTGANQGPKKASIIADKLDTYLVGKLLNSNTGTVQLGKSSMNVSGIDKDDSTLYRVTYTIPFNYFEVT